MSKTTENLAANPAVIYLLGGVLAIGGLIYLSGKVNKKLDGAIDAVTGAPAAVGDALVESVSEIVSNPAPFLSAVAYSPIALGYAFGNFLFGKKRSDPTYHIPPLFSYAGLEMVQDFGVLRVKPSLRNDTGILYVLTMLEGMGYSAEISGESWIATKLVRKAK